MSYYINEDQFIVLRKGNPSSIKFRLLHVLIAYLNEYMLWDD